ncbi:MAG: urea carboxylase-associated family protein [Thiotrichales bacterium]|nr:urea carboxylase-associated family protein [Thiotrichales bacterium]
MPTDLPSGPSRVAAGTGRAFQVPAGHLAEIATPEGPQVADTWAFALPDLDEFLSTEHTRSCLDRLAPHVGEAFYSNQRRPILTVVEDTSPGCHDLLMSACDVGRYTLLGHRGYHANCIDNLGAALKELNLQAPELPSPVNVFENVTIGTDGTLHIEPPRVRPGESLTLRAEMDLVLVVCACPMDIVLTNGSDRRPKPIDVSVMPAGESPRP